MKRRSFADVARGNLSSPCLSEKSSQINGIVRCLGHNFIRYATRGDGNCFFRGVSDWVYNTMNDYMRVRKEVVQYVVDRWSELGDMVGLCYDQCKCAKDYENFMGKDCEYAGQVEVIAAAKFYKRPVCVFNKSSNSFIVEKPLCVGGDPIVLYYDYAASHYEVLKEACDRHYKILQLTGNESNTQEISNDRDSNSNESLSSPVYTSAFTDEISNTSKSKSCQPPCSSAESLPGVHVGQSDMNRESPINKSQRLGPNYHSRSDNRDILFCYLWGKRAARHNHGGYMKYMTDKWSEIRPDKNLTQTALATKGKRLFDRANNDAVPVGSWLGKDELNEIILRVNQSFNENTPPAEPVNETDVAEAIPSLPDKEAQINDPVFDTYMRRCLEMYDMLIESPLLCQSRRTLRKKNLSYRMQKYANEISKVLMEKISECETPTLDQINTVIYSVAVVFTFKEGSEFTLVDRDAKHEKKDEPAWKQRLSNNVSRWRREVDTLKDFLSGNLKKMVAVRYAHDIVRRYRINGDKQSITKLIFNLKNKIKAVSQRIKRYETQEKSKKQNEMFTKNRKQFYREVSPNEQHSIPNPPTEADLREFWGNKIFGQTDLYNPDADWIPEWKQNYKDVEEQVWSGINLSDMACQLGHQANWKAPGVDKIPNYWLKNLPHIHTHLSCAMEKCIESPETIPEWLVTGRTTLLPKNSETSSAKNFRPITCLTTFWKTLTGILATKIERHLKKNDIMSEEQQGAIKGSYGTKKQLVINKTLLEHAIKYRRNMSITYIDYAKAYDSVPHPWIIEALETYKISSVIIKFIKHAMSMWNIKLILNHDNGTLEVPNIKIKRGIFQGDTLSPLLFIIAINPLSYLLNKSKCGYKINDVVFSHVLYMDDIKTFSGSSKGGKEMIMIMYNFTTSIGMSFGIDKCKVLNIKRGKYVKEGNVVLPNGEVITEMEEDDAYKYLGVLESVSIKHANMKTKVLTTFKKRLKSILKTELNSKNIMTAIGEYALPVISYTFGVIHWTEGEIKNIDVVVRKHLNMFRMFPIMGDVDRLYIPREMGGRGLMSVWDSFVCTMARISHYINGAESECMRICLEFDKSALFSITKKASKLLTSLNFVPPDSIENKPLLHQAKLVSQKCKDELHKERLNKFTTKPQHGAYFRQLKNDINVNQKESMSWLNKCHIQPQSEAYICGLQELAIPTRWHEKNLFKTSPTDSCRVCLKEIETTSHILSGCDNLAKKEYLERHNNVAKYVHFEICKKLNINTQKKWHLHSPKDVIMNSEFELIWDIQLVTDRAVGANRPDIVLREKKVGKTVIIDISCPNDINVHDKENEKISKYSALRVELGKMWNCRCCIVPVVIGSLGTTSCKFREYLKMIPAEVSPELCQKITVLGSEKLMRSFLSRK